MVQTLYVEVLDGYVCPGQWSVAVDLGMDGFVNTALAQNYFELEEPGISELIWPSWTVPAPEATETAMVVRVSINFR